MPLKSLAEIRGDSSDSPSSSGGLKSLGDIRFAQQQQSLKQDYPQMEQDQNNYDATYKDSNAPAQQENAQYADAMKSAYQASPQAFQQEDNSRSLPVIGPILRGLDAVANNPVVRTFDNSAGQAMGVPDNMMNPAVSTGNNLVDKGIGFLGGAAGYLTNPAQIEQNVGQTFFDNQPLQNLGSRVGGAIENNLPNNVATRALANTAEQGTIGALGSAAYAPFQTLNQGGDVQDIPRNMLEQGLMGGVLGGAGGALGSLGKSGLSAISDNYAGTKIGDALGNLLGNKQADIQPQEGQLSLPQGSGEARFNAAQERSNLSPNETPITGRDNIVEPLNSSESTSLKSLSDIKSEYAPNELKPLSQIKDESLNTDAQPQPRIRDKVVDYMDKQAEAAQQRINARNNIGFVAPKGNDAVDYAIIGAAHIVRNGVKYADFSEMMLNHYGNQIKPYIPGIYKSSVELAKKEGRMTKKDIRRSFNHDQFNKNNTDETIPDTRGQIVSKTKREPINLGKSIDNAYIKNVDNLHSMNLLGKAAEKLTGEKISPEDNPHTLALNTRSNDMITHQIANEHLVDPQGNVIGPSLKDITKQIPKKQYSEFMDYLVNQHAIDRMNRGEKVFDDSLKMSPEKSAEIVKRYDEKYPEFSKIATQYHDWMDKLGQSWLVDTGRIPQEVWDAYRKESPNYVPNFREMSDLEKRNNFGGGKQSFSGQGSGVKEAKGSGQKIIDPIESTIEMISKNVKGAKNNEVMQSLSRVLEKKPEGLKGFAENVKEPEGQKPLTKQEMLQKLNDEGIEGLLKHEDDSYTSATAKPDLTKGNIVPYMKDGVPHHIKVNDIHLLDAISNISPKSQGVVLEGLGKMTKVMKTLTTGINPIFSFTRNIFRDIPDSYKNSTTTNNPVTFASDLVHSAISAFGNGELAQSYKAMGGGHAGHVSASRNLLKQSKTNILAHEGAKDNLKYVAQKAWHLFENFNSALETAPRLAEYKRTVKQGGNTYASKVQGIANANDISVNFNRFGTVSKEIDKVIPYYNAAIQGLDKTIRSYKNNPIQATMKSVAAITLPTIALYYINHNDPNYQKLSEYTKDNYFLFPKGDGTFYKIPKPREAGFIFGTMVEQMLRLWNDHDPNAFKNFGEYVKNVWAPPGVSGMIDTQNKSIDPMGPLKDSIFGPLVGTLANKDFMDRPIVPKSLQGLSPDMQYNQNTSEIGKSLAKLPLNNLSPMQIDYLLKSYGGGVAQFGLPLATKGKSIGNTLSQQVTADPTYSNDISQDFYNAKTQYDQQKADAKAQGKVSNTVGTDSYIDKMATAVSQIQKQIKGVQNNPNMADDTKQNQINALQLKMNNMQTQVLNQIKKATR